MIKKRIGVWCGLLILSLVRVVFGEIQQGDVDVELEVPQIIQLEILTADIKIIPGPEDYARNLDRSEFGGGYETSDPGKGFAERSSAIELTIFSNAQNGAFLFVHGIQPPAPTGVLLLEDIYLAVQREKTYILQNNLEGATTKYSSFPPPKKTYWMRLYTEAQEIFRVTQATKDARLIVFKLGIGNLAAYTHGTYKNTITFSLMPSII